MRILEITVSANYGGGPQHIYDLICHFDDNMIIDVACPKQEPFWSKYKSIINGCLINIPERRFSLWYASLLFRHIRRHKIQIIHSHGKGAGVYGRLLAILTGIPLIHTPHGLHIDQYGWLKKKFYLLYERLTGWIDTYTILVSKSEFLRARSLDIGMDNTRIIIVNGVENIESDLSILNWRNDLRRSLRIADNDIVVASLCTFSFAKNTIEMVRIAKLLPGIRFWLLGNGPDYGRVQSFCKEYEIMNVWMPGMINNPIKYLAASDIYLSSSLWEGLPLSVLQAMSLAKPVVASDVTGNRDAVVSRVTGLLYKCGDVDEAVKIIKFLINNANLINKMGKAGKHVQQKKFSVINMAKKTQNLYSSLNTRQRSIID